ncbi:MAG: hypothetical protein AAGE65_11640 [Planctomycetota bacterium]
MLRLRNILHFLLVIIAPSLLLAVVVVYQSYYPSRGSNTTSQVANRVLWDRLNIPEAAQDVTFFVDWGGCEAEFALEERLFVELCQSRDWTFTDITEPVPYFKPIWLEADTRWVVSGYTFNIPDGEGVFDRDRSRVAFFASTFP